GTVTTSTGTLYEPIRYAGGYWDSHQDAHGPALYKFGERYYDPTLGRWTQRDALDNPLDLKGWNQYLYAGDDPVNEIDPTGLCGVHTLIHRGILGCTSWGRHLEDT